MANWTILKAAIADIIKTNGNQEITGQLLQNVLNNIVSSVGENATFAGIAIPTTNPGAPDGPVFYLAATAGIYPNFNGNEVLGGEAAILLWNNGAWSKKVTGFATQKKLIELEYYAGVQSDLNVTFEDKADGSIDVVFNKRVIFIKNGHRGFNLTFDSYPQTFNVPIYYTLAMNVETREVALQSVNDGIEVQNNLILLHNEPKGVFNGVFAMLYNTTKINTSLNDFIQYKNIDKGGSAISPYSSISIRKGDGSNLIVKFSAAKYNIVDDYGNNPNFTIDAGTELIVPNYGAIFADIASRKIILSNNYYARASKQILLAYNEGGVMLSGLLKGLYDNTFNNAPVIIKAERDFVDITYYQKINNAWVSATNVENRYDTNFDLYYYSIDSHTSKVQLYNATGGGHTIFLDADSNVLLTHQSSPQYQSAWYEYDVPQGTTMIKVTHAKWQEKYPYAFPLRVRANHQAYTNDFIQYKNIDNGGSAISPYSSISIRKGDGSNLIVKFSAAKYNIVDDYGNNPNFTIDAGTELIVPNYGAIFADIASRKIILSNNYYARASKQILLAYNEGGVMLSGLLKGLYDNTFNNAPVIIKAERDFVDITYYQKINNAWVSATNVENRYDTNFDLYYYSIDSHTSKVQLYNATGGGHTIFLDADSNVLLTHQSSPQYQSAWYEYDVPQGTTMIKVTHAKWQEKYPYAFPLRVRANHQAYTNDNLLNLKGKKVVFFGDSITEMGYYVNAFQKMTGCNVVKRGVSGTSFTKTTGREDSLSERIDLPSSDAVGNKLGLPSEADLVIVLAGVNDWGQRNNWGIDLGSMTAAIDKTNFTGAVKYVFSKLREKYPTTPIVVLSMLHVYHPTSFGTWREITYSDGQYGGEITYLTDKDGNTMDVWRKRVGEAANFYGIPFVNMTQCGFTPFLQSDNETFMPDGLHPSEEGGEIMAKYIIAQIKSLIS